MKNSSTSSLKIWIFLFLFVSSVIFQRVEAQVGINTTTPHASSALEIASTTQGMLTPRMTTAQKLAIATPANGLLVYDTDFKEYSYYDLPATTWVNIKQGRSKFKRIKSTDVLATVLATELAAGGGAKYLLDTQTLYEINGTIMVNFPIELNNAYLTGLDSGEDKLVKTSGDLFTGTTGGSIKGLTISVPGGGNIFNIIGPGAIGAQTQTLIFRDCIVANSSNVGKIENFSLLFMSIIQFSGNTNGIIYKDIRRLLISNVAWFGNNLGTFETLQGTFDLVQKNGGFNGVTGAAIGFDVSANPTIIADAVMNEVVFAGTLTTGKYVNGYTTGSYPGFNFDNYWSVDCTGIPVEGDSYTVGDVNFDYPLGSGVLTTLTTGTPVKISGTTVANNFFRASTGAANNRLQYLGHNKRFFTINAALSFQASNGVSSIYIFFIAKNGVVINRSKAYSFTTNATDTFAIPLQCAVELLPNDYVEVFAERYSGTSNILTVSLNLFMK